MTEKCEAAVWRGTAWHEQLVMCGKPAKGYKRSMPVCGVHLRAKYPVKAPGR